MDPLEDYLGLFFSGGFSSLHIVYHLFTHTNTKTTQHTFFDDSLFVVVTLFETNEMTFA